MIQRRAAGALPAEPDGSSYRFRRDGPFVFISRDVLDLLGRHRQVSANDPESGGVLLGERKVGGHLHVQHATPPSIADRRSRYSFVRNRQSHQRKIDCHWDRSHGRCVYLGEWHTHAEPLPSPSTIDRLEWERLASGLSPERLLFLIQGTNSLWAGLLLQGKLHPLEPLRIGSESKDQASPGALWANSRFIS